MMTIQQWFLVGMKRSIPQLLNPDSPSIDLGCGNAPVIGVDFTYDWPDWVAPAPIPVEDDWVGTIWCHHLMEHLEGDAAVALLREMQRILKPGGTANIVTPYYNSFMQAQDLDHRSRYNEETWKTIFTNKYYEKHGTGWQLRVHACFIIGVVERNLALFTQLVKIGEVRNG